MSFIKIRKSQWYQVGILHLTMFVSIFCSFSILDSRYFPDDSDDHDDHDDPDGPDGLNEPDDHDDPEGPEDPDNHDDHYESYLVKKK